MLNIIKRVLLPGIGVFMLAACGTIISRTLTHPSAQQLPAEQTATVYAPDSQGWIGGYITLVVEHTTKTAWPPEEVSKWSEAKLAPGRHTVAVACFGLGWSQVFPVEIDAIVGHIYRLSCDVVRIDEKRVAARVLVTDEGVTERGH